MDNRPIGIFDSGIGGITVLKALRNLMPNEDYLYFGDTGRVPYGSKSPEIVIEYSVQIANFLKKEGVKAITIACNTSSARAGKILEDIFDIPIIGVIKTTAKESVATTKNGSIGIIGTKNTITSQAHKNEILALNNNLKVYGIECPMFVPYIEEGEINSYGLSFEIKQCLTPLIEQNIDTLILGCTHYPLIKSKIQDFMGEDVELINPGTTTSKEVFNILENKKLLNSSEKKGGITFYITGGIKEFQSQLEKFSMTNIHIHPVEITKLNQTPKVYKAEIYKSQKKE